MKYKLKIKNLITLLFIYLLYFTNYARAGEAVGIDKITKNVTQEEIKLQGLSPEAVITILAIFVVVVIIVIVAAYLFFSKNNKDKGGIGWDQ